MFPIILDVSRVHIGLIGEGDAAKKRIKQLLEAGAENLTVFLPNVDDIDSDLVASKIIQSLPNKEDLHPFSVVMIVGLNNQLSQTFADYAKDMGKLVNVEDKKPLCDFHFPSFLRRGDLLITVSTGGKSPALARSIKNKLESFFPQHWEHYVKDIAKKRDEWQQQQLSFSKVMQKSDEYIQQQGWL